MSRYLERIQVIIAGELGVTVAEVVHDVMPTTRVSELGLDTQGFILALEEEFNVELNLANVSGTVGEIILAIRARS